MFDLPDYPLLLLIRDLFTPFHVLAGGGEDLGGDLQILLPFLEHIGGGTLLEP